VSDLIEEAGPFRHDISRLVAKKLVERAPKNREGGWRQDIARLALTRLRRREEC
jgi:hypothetical protein